MQGLESEPVSIRSGPLTGTHELVPSTALGGDLPCGLFLGSLDDGGYLIPARRELSAGLAASAVVELAFRGRIRVEGERLIVTGAAPTGDAVVDPVLDLLAARRRAPDVGRCLEDLSLDWTILGRTGQVLEAEGLVRIERRALHPLIMHRFHPVSPERPALVRARLRSILEGAAKATPHEAALACLAEATRLPGVTRGEPAPCAFDPTAAGQVLSAVHAALVSATLGRREAERAHA